MPLFPTPSSAIGSLGASVLPVQWEKARRCVHGPTRPAELGLWTGGVWGAAPGDAGTEFSLSPGAARGNRGAKCLSCPRRLRAGAGASPGLHGLASGSSACWSSKATPGKGTLLPFWELLAGPPPPGQAQSQVASCPKPRCPVGSHNSYSCPSALLLSRSCLPPPPPRPSTRVGGRDGLGRELALDWPRSAAKEVGSENVEGLDSWGGGHPDAQSVHRRAPAEGAPRWRLVTGGGPRG